ncbi:hypothetical protein [Butyricicoccus sp. AM05-1]|jgi:hypothetical protein|uniref:hypothetical protein n=2 Tax=unclassified Butyricicoccus TaxID=2633649 RepID=UPI003FA45665
MPQYMTAETWEEHRLIVNVIVFKDFAITIAHDSAQCLIQCSLMLYLSESVDKEVINAKTAAPDHSDATVKPLQMCNFTGILPTSTQIGIRLAHVGIQPGFSVS